jgi:hypothetical protein
MCVRALRITVLKSAGNFTRDEGHDLNAEKIQRVKCFMHEVRNLLRASNFRTPARPAGFENFRLWLIGGSAVYFAMSGLPPEADTNRKGRHVRWVPKPEVFNGLGHVPLVSGCRRFDPVTAYHRRAASCARIKHLVTCRSQ